MDRTTDIDRLAELAIPSVGAPASASPSVGAPTMPSAEVFAAVSTASVATSAADEDPFDYGADADPDSEVVARAFAELDKLTLAAERLTAQRKQAEDQLAKIKQAEEQLLNKDIPELLGKMRLDECTTASGIAVKVKREIKMSLPGHERVEARMGALRWLIEHGHGGVIKNQVTVALDRGEDSRADELVVELRAKGLNVDAKKDVHPSTLSALGRELFAAGTIVPRENFNIFDMKIAKLSRK